MRKRSVVRGGRLPRRKYRFRGGPLDGESVRLTCPGTLPIRLRGMRGYYDNDNRWVEVEDGNVSQR